jgi:hypothetical protein
MNLRRVHTLARWTPAREMRYVREPRMDRKAARHLQDLGDQRLFFLALTASGIRWQPCPALPFSPLTPHLLSTAIDQPQVSLFGHPVPYSDAGSGLGCGIISALALI